MEHDVVFADEVYHPGIRAFPPLLPVVRKKFLGVGDVSDRGIEPYIEDLAFCFLQRYGNSPVQIPGYGPRSQTSVYPALALAVNVGLPFLVTVLSTL